MTTREFYIPGISCGFCSHTGAKIHSNDKCSARSDLPHVKLTAGAVSELLKSSKELCLLCWTHSKLRLQGSFETDLAAGTTTWNPLANPGMPTMGWFVPVDGYRELPDIEMHSG